MVLQGYFASSFTVQGTFSDYLGSHGIQLHQSINSLVPSANSQDISFLEFQFIARSQAHAHRSSPASCIFAIALEPEELDYLLSFDSYL